MQRGGENPWKILRDCGTGNNAIPAKLCFPDNYDK